MKILACVDFTAMTDDVLAAAGDLAAQSAGSVAVMHAAAPEPEFMGYDEPGGPRSREDRDEQLASERTELVARTDQLRELDILVSDPVLRVGPTAETILGVAVELDADVIVIGRHRHGRLHDLLLGNTATKVVRLTDRLILLVPPRDQPAK